MSAVKIKTLLSEEEHLASHQERFKSFCDLLNEFIFYENSRKLETGDFCARTSIIRFFRWAKKQAECPTHDAYKEKIVQEKSS